MSAAGDILELRFPDGAATRHNRYWLRDNCPADEERASLFRAFSVAEIPEDLVLVRAASTRNGVDVEFSDGTVARFDPAWLRDHAASGEPGPACAVPWRAGHQADRFDAAALERGSVAHLALLEAVARAGMALVRRVPDHGTEPLARLLGHIRETDFGRIFDIVTEPHPFTPSQSDAPLDPHTDDPYRYTPAGMSILHCVIPSAEGGGETIVVDGFAVAESIRADDPEAFELLATVPVPFVHRRASAVPQGDDVHLRAEAPVVATDRHGRVVGIRFHERSMGPLPLEPELAERYYPALVRFARAVRSDDFAWRRRLAAGEAIVYDNQRVLHGRTGFSGAATRRHLRLCTVDRDQVHSRLRRLRERHGTGTECDPLPAGSLS